MMTRQGGWAAAALALVCVTAIARPAPADADPAEHRINVAKTPWCGCCGDWDCTDRGGRKGRGGKSGKGRTDGP